MTTKELSEKIAHGLRQAQEISGADQKMHLCYVNEIENIFLIYYSVFDNSRALEGWRDAAGANRIDEKV